MMRWIAALTLLVCPAHAADLPLKSFPIQRGGLTFTTPSDNIECHFTVRGGSEIYRPKDNLAELSCDRAQPTSIRFVIGEKGAAEMIRNPGEQPCCSDENPLPYGFAWEVSPFRCESATSGLACTRTDGHGFHISRAEPKVF